MQACNGFLIFASLGANKNDPSFLVNSLSSNSNSNSNISQWVRNFYCSFMERSINNCRGGLGRLNGGGRKFFVLIRRGYELFLIPKEGVLIFFKID